MVSSQKKGAVLGTLLVSLAFALADQVQAASIDSAVLAACRRIPETAARLECFDRLTDALTGQGGEPARAAAPAAMPAPVAPPPPVAVAPAPARVAPAAAPSAAAVVPTPPPAAAPSIRPAAPAATLRPPEPTPKDQQLENKNVTLTRVSRTGTGFLVLVTDTEGTWVQTDGGRVEIEPEAGDTVNIRRAMFGS